MSSSFSALHKVVVLGVPLVLGVLEMAHPAFLPPESVIGTLMPIRDWWTLLHLLQVPLFALLGVAAWLLVRDRPGRAAQVSRRAIAVFTIIYPAFDAAVGIASGVILRTIETEDPAQLAALEIGLEALFWGPLTGFMAVVGSVSWLVALIAAAVSWRQAGAPWYPVAALVLAGLLLGIAHVRPLGPLACLFFLVGAAWVVFKASGSRVAAV
jgi:hypothetical protein